MMQRWLTFLVCFLVALAWLNVDPVLSVIHVVGRWLLGGFAEAGWA